MKSAVAPHGCTNLKLRQLGRMVNRHYDHHLSAVGLKSTQYALLSCVVKLGPIRPLDLARRLQMDASTLTRNLQPMVAQGWLAVGAGENARSRLIAATAEGKTVRAEAQRAWKSAQTALNHRLGVAQVSALHDLLDTSIAALDHYSPAVENVQLDIAHLAFPCNGTAGSVIEKALQAMEFGGGRA